MSGPDPREAAPVDAVEQLQAEVRSLVAKGLSAEQIEAGAVGVNVNDTSELQAPFGGWKMSGIGRELGREGIEAFRETKHIKMRVRRRV